MKRNVRKIAVILLAVMLFSALTMAAYASAVQRDFSKYITFSGFTAIGETGEKSNNSDLYIRINSCTGSNYVSVRALGCDDDGDNTVNLTRYNGQIVDSVQCYIGRDYAVDSYIYERGYDFATFALKVNGPSMTASGYWAPDTYANHGYTQATTTP